MNIRFATIAISLLAVTTSGLAARELALVPQQLPNPDNEPAPVHPLPHPRQLKWMETEFYAFFHYGMNTFTDKEWGYGNEPESIYNPLERPNPRQWLEAVKAAGMKGGIAVVKHHDGFCLWPTESTTHNITNSGNRFSDVNIAEEFANAARDLDMKYGFYVSPWDRNSAYYGDGTNDYVEKVFKTQCRELTQYGTDQFEMWFDGANGGDGYYGGADTVRSVDQSTYYDIPNLRHWVHQVMPDCVMWGVGDEARWIGNEAGFAAETNWCFGKGTTGNADAWYWRAGESDAKATSHGWFWHNGQKVHSADRIWQFYMETIGRNATLILNFPPDQRGLLPDDNVAVLKEFGDMLRQRMGTDLALEATATATHTRRAGASRTYAAGNLIDGDKDTYWATDDGDIASALTLTWDSPKLVHLVSLQEYLPKGQRVTDFSIEYSPDGTTWLPFGEGMTTSTIGYKRIISANGSTKEYGPGVEARAIRVNIADAKASPLLHTISVY